MFITRGINEKLGIAFLAILACASASAQADPCKQPFGEAVTVVAVDIHLEPRLADGRKLRLRGIEPPRGTTGNPQLAEQARAFTAGLLEGQPVSAAIASPGPDRWGRHAADLVRGGANVAGEVIARGWARVEPLDADTSCLPALYQLESAAREAGLGLWADPAYAVLDAADSAAFAQLAGRIVLAEGIVAGVGKWRTLTFINFGRGRRGEVSASLSRRVAQAMETRGTTLAGLKGSRIRVRGPLQLRTSPRIEIFSAGAIEIMSSPVSKK